MSIRQSVRFVSMGFVGALALTWSVQAAEIDLDATDKNAPVATYAVEALSKADGDTQEGEDKKTYYEVMSSTTWTVTSGLKFGILSGQTVLIRFDFENMVFAEDLAAEHGTLGGGTLHRLIDGEAGANSVVLSGTTTGNVVAGEAEVTLTLGDKVAVSPDGPVSVKMVVTLRGLTDIIAPYEAGYTGAIAVAPALSVEAAALSPTAAVAHGFKRFVTDPGTIGDLGKVTIMAKAAYLKAEDGAAVSSIAELIGPGTAGSRNTDASASKFELMGNFSPFVDTLTLEADAADCKSATGSNLLKRDKETMEAARIVVPLTAGDLTGLKYDRRLCINVRAPDDDDAMAIPATSPYMAMMDFAATDDDQLRTPADRTLDLGRIRRDGTTVHLPYVTTYEGYNQRITLSNRSGVRARYEFSFRPEDKVVARPGMNATGMLAAGQTLILRAVDLVTLTGGSRTAATVSVVAQPTDIDISSTLVDLDTGVAALTVHLSDNGLRQ